MTPTMPARAPAVLMRAVRSAWVEGLKTFGGGSHVAFGEARTGVFGALGGDGFVAAGIGAGATLIVTGAAGWGSSLVMGRGGARGAGAMRKASLVALPK